MFEVGRIARENRFMDTNMRHKTYLKLLSLISASLISTASLAGPISYADIIAAEKEKMMKHHPYNQQQNSANQNLRAPISTPTWGLLIKNEHDRLMQLYPQASVNQSQAMQTKRQISNPIGYGELIEMQKDRMKHWTL